MIFHIHVKAQSYSLVTSQNYDQSSMYRHSMTLSWFLAHGEKERIAESASRIGTETDGWTWSWFLGSTWASMRIKAAMGSFNSPRSLGWANCFLVLVERLTRPGGKAVLSHDFALSQIDGLAVRMPSAVDYLPLSCIFVHFGEWLNSQTRIFNVHFLLVAVYGWT